MRIQIVLFLSNSWFEIKANCNCFHTSHAHICEMDNSILIFEIKICYSFYNKLDIIFKKKKHGEMD